MGRRGKNRFHKPFSDIDTPPASASEVPAEDARAFETAMTGVRPLQHKKVRVPPSQEPALNPANNDSGGRPPAPKHQEYVFRIVEEGALVEGAAQDVSREILRNLRRGEYSITGRLDLHGYTREEASMRISAFVRDAREQGKKCVLIITGRGRGSPGGISTLRESLPQWLTRGSCNPHVLAFCAARPTDGGEGAFYVLLRRPRR